MYKIGDIFYDDNEYSARAEFCNNNNLVIKEIESDDNGRRFTIVEPPQPTEQEIIIADIFNKKKLLEKYKEDVEQVELFGMDRMDYEEKRSKCAEIILELRNLENELANLQ